MIISYAFLVYLMCVLLNNICVNSRYSILIPNDNMGQKKYHGKLFAFFALIFLAIIGLRGDTVGIDTWNYAHIYRTFASIKDWKGLISYSAINNYYEIGYNILLFAFSKIGLEIWQVRLIFACIACVPVFMLIYQKSRSYVLSLFLYLAFGEYVFAFSGMRQGAAIGLVVMAYLQVMKGNRLKAIIWILLATTIHTSAFIALPILFISKIKVSKKTIILFLGVSGIILGFQGVIFNLLRSYAARTYDDIQVGGTMFSVFLIFTTVINLYIFTQYTRDMSEDEREMQAFLFWNNALTAMVYLFARLSPVYLRLTLYYQILMIISVPNMLSIIKEKVVRICATAAYICIGLFYYYTYVLYSYDIVPYVFFWEGV